ncbi:MAG: biopolymer transporter ExbD [Verrucomicrobia bacterium]|nr:biopolymer transporter ExbD [Verrucomicrobiota bacterium]
MRRFSKKHLSVLAEINVTPLLDLAFVLLIIFIITTPLFEQAIGVNLAKAAKAEQQKVPRGRTVSIDKVGQLYVDRSPVDLDTLRTSMRALVADVPDAAVLVRVDKEQQFEKFVQVLDVLKSCGITRVGIVALTEGKVR